MGWQKKRAKTRFKFMQNIASLQNRFNVDDSVQKLIVRNLIRDAGSTVHPFFFANLENSSEVEPLIRR